jgi:hypothetical protein
MNIEHVDYTTTHLGFYNWLIKQLLFIFTIVIIIFTIVIITSSC